jgi:hypothetical protein
LDSVTHWRNAVRLVAFLLVAAGTLACAGCDDKASAQGGGTSNSSYGRVKVGLPF